MLKKLFVILIALGFMGALAGCNTMHGLGQDIEQGGDNLKRKADEVKNK